MRTLYFLYPHGASARIRAWFEAHGPGTPYAAIKFYEHLYETTPRNPPPGGRQVGAGFDDGR